MKWGPDELARIEAGARAGKSAGQIALDFGVTRNAIIGTARRGGIKLNPPAKRRKREAGVVLNGVRKAYKSKGDDVTLTRFIKTATRRRTYQPLLLDSQRAPSPKLKNRAAVIESRTVFRKSVKRVGEVKNLLSSGHNNVKIGRDIRIGPFIGYWIYTLSLQERATCPASCHYWETCYGNNMPYAKRIDHTDLPALTARLEQEIRTLLPMREGRRGQHPRKGLMIRLHALGDFFSVPYVRFWSHMLALHDKLAIYGYTAHSPESEIGREIERLKLIYGRRFAVRWSNGGLEKDCTVPVQPGTLKVPGAFICPEQMDLADSKGRPILCATCGLCWGTDKNVAFMEH